MSVKNIFLKIGSFFSHLFIGAQATWKHLSPEVQDALKYGSGVIDTINANIEHTPAFIIDLIASLFPGLDREHLLAALIEASKDLNIAQDINNNDLETVMKNVQTYLGGLRGSAWAKISNFLAQGIALFTAPKGTKFAVVTSLLEFVYQTFFKKK